MKKIGVVFIITILQASVSLATQLSLGRILKPEIFGQFAICAAITAFLMTLTNLQSDKFIITESETEDGRYSTVVTTEIILSISVMLFAFLLLPLLLSLLNKPNLLLYSQLLSLAVFYNPLCRYKSVLDKNFRYIASRIPQSIAQVLSALIAIGLALKGWGIWSLISWRLCTFFFELIILHSLYPTLPKISLDIDSIRELLKFVAPLYMAAIIFVIYSTFDYYILSYFIDDRALGHYWMAFQLTSYFLIIKTTFNGVLLPYYSKTKCGEDKINLQNHQLDAVSYFFLILCLVGFAFSKELITLILGELWTEMYFIFNLFLIVVSLKAFSGSVVPYLISKGKRNVELFSLVVALAVFFSTIYILSKHFGVIGALLSALLSVFISMVFLYYGFIRNENTKFLFSSIDLVVQLITLYAIFVFFEISFTQKILIFLLYIGFLGYKFCSIVLRLNQTLSGLRKKI